MTEPDTEPWRWAESRWRGYVEHVRAGRSLAPATWPDGKRVAVAISFDSDHETPALRDGEVLPGKLAQGEYGARVGVPRILRLLAEHGIPATFFVPAVSALLHDGEVARCAAEGHEIALHGWIHERNTGLDRSAERDLMLRSADVLEKLAGSRPVGLRTPSWDFSDATLDLVVELGLAYDSSLMADDEPYELLSRGAPTGVVELPVEWIRDDAPYFMMDRFASLRPYTPPREVGRIWRDEFDGARAEGGLFQLTLHPHIIGHRSRLVVLAELIDHIVGTGDAWFATHSDVVAHVLKAAEIR